MAIFEIQKIGESGKIEKSKREAADRATLYKELQSEGVNVVSLREIVKHSFSFGKLAGGMQLSQLKTRDKILFAHNMSAMLVAGLTISRILSVLERQARGAAARRMYSAIAEEIRNGKPLSEALKQYHKTFPQFFISMVHAGEESGKLADSLRVVANQMEKFYLLKKRLRGALIYPSIVVTLMIAIAFILLTFVVPTLTATFQELDVKLPLSTRIVIGSSAFMKNNVIIVIGAIIAALVVFISALRSGRGKRILDGLFLRVPVLGVMIREYYSAQTARTLSSLLSSGVVYILAMEITKDVVQNTRHKEVLELARARVEKGEPISAVFSEHEREYPPFVAEMVAVGEETGRLSDMLGEVANFYEAEVDQKTKDLSTIIEPVLMIVIGVAVGFFAVAMISPTYSVFTNI